jgi:replicative DNA helicase
VTIITSTAAAGVSTGLYLLRAIIDAHARSEFRQVNDSMFLTEELPAYQFIQRFYLLHGAFPTPSACAENGHILPAGGNPVGYYMERCETRAMYNAIATGQASIAAAMQRRDPRAALQILRGVIRSADAVQAASDTATLHALTEEVLRDYEHAHHHPGMQGVTLGWGVLDLLTGGAEGGDVVTFAARPGMGKSWLLTHIARRAWLMGTSVLFVSMEMTAKQIARRFLSMQAGVAPDPIRTGQLSEWTRDVVYQQLEVIRTGVPFHMLTGSFDKSVPLVDAAVQEFSPGLICIDASYLMDPADKTGNRKMFEALTDVAKEIKQMAMSRNRPVVQTVQFNREATKAKRRGTEHIGGSDAVGQITTIGVAIKEGETAGTEKTRRTLSVFKNREGEDQTKFEVDFLFRPPSFEFVPPAASADEDGAPPPAVDHETIETAGGI